MKIRLELEFKDFAALLICMNSLQLSEPELMQLKDMLNEKLDKMVLHDLYSKSKTAPTEQEREHARQKYLDSRGISESFRW